MPEALAQYPLKQSVLIPANFIVLLNNYEICNAVKDPLPAQLTNKGTAGHPTKMTIRNFASQATEYFDCLNCVCKIPLSIRDVICSYPSYLLVCNQIIVDTTDLILNIAERHSPSETLQTIALASTAGLVVKGSC
ncbi:MAG: hypothetical protein EZS28_014113 [Streblomastix strix]|uniref:Uncharacterized protein n=1 Tax=Streblomastix strix TaxID=222440 RepID=A0A5J4W760_9EUKA|nr:MAG: hypothetical protein EZS28_014113 [Streblomastix strix]